ncbi:MAG: GNAT family N-acetyltransferase [Lachnospiraceae bacterium]
MLKHIIFLLKEELKEWDRLETETEKHGVRLWKEMPKEDLLLQECLFVTDMVSVGEKLLLQKTAVLFWLNDKNQEEKTLQFPYAAEGLKEMEFSYLDRVYRRFHRLPWQIGETKRCIIREMEEADLDALYELYADESISRYTENLYEDREKEREYIRSYIDNAYAFWGFGTWIVERKEDHKVIGRVGFNLRQGYEEPELGFVIGKPYQHQGLAYEVCKESLVIGRRDYGFTAVQALVQEENQISGKLCQKLGFTFGKKVIEQGRQYLLYQIQLAIP